MQKESTIQQFGLKAVGLILALLILIAGTAGINIAYAADDWDDGGSWDDDGTWDDDGNDDGYAVGYDAADDPEAETASSDYEPYFVTAEGGMGVFRAGDGSYVRENDDEDPEYEDDEYLSYYVNIKNTDPNDHREQPASYRIDGGIEKPFSDVTQTEGGETQYHVDLQDMAELDPGLHEIEVFVNNEWVRTDRFYVPRDWDEIMNEPTEEQINAVSKTGRSTYVVYYPEFEETIGLKEYSLDFSIDKMDKGTYFSTISAGLDVSELYLRGLSLTSNYGSTGGLYGGFQCLDNGETGVIMTVWNVIGTDKQGNKQVIKAKPLYMDEKGKVLDREEGSEGEGDFQQFKMEYPWQAQHHYRMLVQMGKNEANGNATATMQICDLTTQEWKKLVTWDLGYPCEYIKTQDLAGFLENYETQYCGSVRSANFSNIRGLDSDTGEWVAADSVKFTTNNGMDDFNYVGSYQFGSEGNSYYAITSGVDGLCKPAESGTSFTVNNPTAEKPY